MIRKLKVITLANKKSVLNAVRLRFYLPKWFGIARILYWMSSRHLTLDLPLTTLIFHLVLPSTFQFSCAYLLSKLPTKHGTNMINTENLWLTCVSLKIIPRFPQPGLFSWSSIIHESKTETSEPSSVFNYNKKLYKKQVQTRWRHSDWSFNVWSLLLKISGWYLYT